MGALDESDPGRPTVVIPNYLSARSNCIASSSLYTICCIDQCEDLLSHLESKIGSPQAAPHTLAQLVATTSSETVDAPRNLSTSLTLRLDEIAQHHGGVVPLHGRLFAQWLHHAYPRECQFPHAAGTINPQRPEDILQEINATDGDIAASEEVMKQCIDAAAPRTR